MDVQTFRHAPAEVELEQAVLGAVLVDNRRLESLTSILKPEDFSDPLHQRTFETMLKIWEQGRTITPLTLSAIMRADPGLVSLKLDYFGVLADAAPAITNVKELARIIRDAAVRRELLRIGEDLANASYETDIDKPPN